MLLPSTNEVCEGYVFTPVCQSFCSQGGCPGPVPGCMPKGGIQAQAQGGPGPGSGGGGVCVSQHSLRQTPLPPARLATAADGTHPTGMHSC